jgi:hypothetical protein
MGMKSDRGNRIRVAVLAAMVIPGIVSVARAKPLPAIIPSEPMALQAAGLRMSALSPQDSQSAAQQGTNAGAAAPSVKVGHTQPLPIATYDHGQLTIVAENVPLSEVMSALHSVMGTEIDIPPSASEDRIWARLGPGPARKILSDLLNNTDLDYVIQGSSKDAGGIQSVTLTLHADDATGKAAAASAESAGRTGIRRPPGYRPDAAVPSEQEEHALPPEAAAAVAESESSAPAPPAAPVEPQAAQAAPVAPGSTAAAVEPSSASNPLIAHPAPPSTMSSDQIVQQLTNMYQQRKQLQQTQTSSTPN